MLRRRENRWEEEIAENEWKIPRENARRKRYRTSNCFHVSFVLQIKPLTIQNDEIIKHDLKDDFTVFDDIISIYYNKYIILK